MIEDAKGRLVETEEEREARWSVRAFWFGKYKVMCVHGKHKGIPCDECGPQEAEPIAPAIEDPPELPITPAPASKAPRYGHAIPHKCLDCPKMIELGKRCLACGSKDKLTRERNRKRRVRQTDGTRMSDAEKQKNYRNRKILDKSATEVKL